MNNRSPQPKETQMNNRAKTGVIVRLEINHDTTGQVQCKAIRRNGPNRRPSRPVILILDEHVMLDAPLPLKTNLDDVERNKAATHRAHASEIQSLKQAAVDRSAAVRPVSLDALSAISRLLAELATPIAASVVRDALEGHLSKLLGDMGLRLEPDAWDQCETRMIQETIEPCTWGNAGSFRWEGDCIDRTVGKWYDITTVVEDGENGLWFIDDAGDKQYLSYDSQDVSVPSTHTAQRATELGL